MMYMTLENFHHELGCEILEISIPFPISNAYNTKFWCVDLKSRKKKKKGEEISSMEIDV